MNYNLPVEWMYYRKGQLLDQLGHREQALIWLNKAVVENANFTNAINYINSIQKMKKNSFHRNRRKCHAQPRHGTPKQRIYYHW